MKSASVLVVGGGIIGASVAWHLAERGWRDVVVIDRNSSPGGGSTGRTKGGFRTHFTSPMNVRLSLLSRKKLARFRDETGGDAGVTHAGYLWVATSPDDLEHLRDGLRVQRAEGVLDVRELGPDEVLRINPALAPDDIVGGVICPSDGFIRPVQMLQGYLSAAERRGVRIRWGVELQSFKRDASRRVTAAVTSDGTIRVGAVVNAAGAWASPLADRAGVALPVLPLRRQVATAPAGGLVPTDCPMTVYLDGFHFRRREDQLILMYPSPGVRGRPYDCTVEPAWVGEVERLVHRRIPSLANVELDPSDAWSGLYEISPDHHAIVGSAPECENFFMACGCSGHGAMHAPALGQLLAEVMTEDEAPALDITPLRFSRFAEGRANPLPGIL